MSGGMKKGLICAEKVHKMKQQLNGRNSRVILVLIQRAASLPGENTMASERLTALCNNVQIPPNSLLVLQLSDMQRLAEIFRRLEGAFAEVAKQYYQNASKLIRNYRDSLNKTTHSLLFVRHQFKLGFYSEIKQDPGGALK